MNNTTLYDLSKSHATNKMRSLSSALESFNALMSFTQNDSTNCNSFTNI